MKNKLDAKRIDLIMRGDINIGNARSFAIEPFLVGLIDDGKDNSFSFEGFDEMSKASPIQRIDLNIAEIGMIKFLLLHMSMRTLEQFIPHKRGTLQFISNGTYGQDACVIPCTLKGYLAYRKHVKGEA